MSDSLARPGIIDAHIHAYPAEVFSEARSWAEARGESWWADAVAPRDRPSIQGWADGDTLLRDMDSAGVEQAVMLGWYWQHQSTCEEQNTWMAEWQQAHPDRLLAFAAVNPAAGPIAIEQTRRRLDAGFMGIGELLGGVQGYSYADPCFGELANLAVEYGVPFNLHVTDPKLNGRPGMHSTPLDAFVAVAERFPAANFILAHLGGGLPWQANVSLPHNLYFDIAAVPLIYDSTVYRQAIDAVGAERILFGTDYPLRVYPRESRTPEFTRPVAEIRDLKLPAEEFDAIMGANLISLLPRA